MKLKIHRKPIPPIAPVKSEFIILDTDGWQQDLDTLNLPEGVSIYDVSVCVTSSKDHRMTTGDLEFSYYKENDRYALELEQYREAMNQYEFDLERWRSINNDIDIKIIELEGELNHLKALKGD